MKNNKENGDTAEDAKKKLLAAKRRKMNDEEAKKTIDGGIVVNYDDTHGAVFDSNYCFYSIFVQHEDDNDIEQLKLKFTARGVKFLRFINYNDNILLNFELNNNEFTETIIDAKSQIAHEFALTPLDSKSLVQFLYQAYYDKKIPIIEKKDKIRIENGIIVVDKPEDYSNEKLQFIYKTLREYYPYAAKPIAYLAVFGHSILSPFFTSIRKNSIKKIKFPLILLHGPTGGGKTTTAEFFIENGFNQEEKTCFFNKNNVKTDFTMSKKLGLTYNPAIIDEVDEQWLISMLPFLKSYTQSVSTASRGTPSLGLKEFEGKMAFVMTTNTSIRLDNDLALFKSRLFDIEYTLMDTERQDDEKFNNLLLSLEPGFMYYVLYDLMQGQDVKALLQEVLYFKKEDFINYGIKKINESLRKLSIPDFPLFHEETDVEYTNTQEFIDAILSEDEKQNSFLSTTFKIEEDDNKLDIYFTGGCFKGINERLRLPYINATNFVSNLSRKGDIIICEGGKAVSKKINRHSMSCFHIQVLKRKENYGKTENNTDEPPSDSATTDYKIDDLPAGPVKDELIQDKEDMANEAAKSQEENRESQPVETLPDTANHDITKDFIEEIREKLASEKFILDGNNGPSFDKKDFQLYVHPTELSMDRFTSLKAIMKSFGFKYSSIQDPYGVRFIRKLGGAGNE